MMKAPLALSFCVQLALCVASAWSDSVAAARELEPAPTLRAAQELSPRYRTARAREAASKELARAGIVRDAAHVYGVAVGYAARAAEIRRDLDARAAELDTIYSFHGLVEGGRLLAPSVSFADQVMAIEGDGSQMRETARVLRVEEPARLVSVPPTWRDYLTIGAPSVDRPDDAMLPATSDEREVWTEAVAEGYDIGRKQAELVLETQMSLLTATYEGMLRYRKLVAQGVIAPAQVGQTDFGIVREDDVLRIQDRVITVTEPARFTDSSRWKPVVERSAEGGR